MYPINLSLRVVRSGGYAEALDKGRAAQKRILDAKKSGGEPDAEDKRSRNQARKARKKASKALQGTE